MISPRQITNCALVVLILSISLTATAGARGDSNPRAVAMGGAYTALARDLEAPQWNPANLGLSDGGSFSINLFSAGLRLKNNSFSLDDYNKYNGKFLTDDDKNDIMNDIPNEGLNVDLGLEASALNFTIGNLAVTYGGLGASSIYLDRDPFELLLMGNAVLHELQMSDSKSEAYAVGDVALSYGQAVKRWLGGEFAVGASFHYLQGLAYGKIVDAQGGVATTDTGFVGSGYARLRTALGGVGYSSDIGLAVRFEKDWYFSAAWQNVASKITWNRETEERLFAFEMKPVTVDFLSEDDSDSLVTNTDTTYAVEQFSSRLTPSVRMGLAKKYRKMVWSVDYEQALFSGPGQSINPKLTAGLEYRLLGWLPLRAGLGGDGSYSTGFGLDFGPCNFDVGLANAGSPSPTQSRGLKVAIGMMLRF